MRNLKNLSFYVLLLGLLAAATSAAVEYEIVDLGTLGGRWAEAHGINDSEQVVGTFSTALGHSRAFLWIVDGGLQDLGALGEGHNYAYGINDSGQVVGNSWTAAGQYHAFLWTANSGIQDLGTLGGHHSQAFGINNSGQVVGHFYPVSGGLHAFLWTADDGMQDLGALGGNISTARGINDLGQVVGTSLTADGHVHACMWIPVTPCTPVSIDSLTAYPLVVPLGDAVHFEATIVDGCGEIDALWDFDDGTVDPQANITSPVTTTKTYTSAGVYTVVLTVSDDKVNVGDTIVVVVYDPTGGFVTGGGWIDSPSGAYTLDESLTGKANFGFVAKYKKGANVPDGQTEFVFKAGDLNFHSTIYDWLVVTGSNYAMFKGTGTINGSGEYRFMLWAGDDDPDTFRIKIWTEDEEGTETVVYDNGFGQPIGGGSIVIHTK